MRCREARRLLVMEETAEYGAPRRGGLRRHLAGCEPCRREVARMHAEVAVIRAAFLELPIRPDFAQGVWSRIGGP
jgi:hypothetical protein